MAIKIRYAHKVSPQGESFQGFWVEYFDGQPLNAKPFATKKDAQVFAGKIETWGDVDQFISAHSLPFKVLRWNMSLRGTLVDFTDSIMGEETASTVYAAREIVLNAAYEMGKIPVPTN